ncbi:MAG: MBL fold metallo-hydrolase RNA specificity domain-containing protein [Propionibacteriaceae bacterium]
MTNAKKVTLTFLGAVGTVTGSKYLLTIGDRRVLIDAGMFQGEKQWRDKNRTDFPVDPATITDILLTHAHTDHVSYVPALVKQGFQGPIWATKATISMAEIVLRDAAKLQEMAAEEAREGGWSKHADPQPLYTTADVEKTLPLFRSVDWDCDLDLGDELTARWTRSGHILGSASINVVAAGASVLFSGDLGRHDHPILKPRATPPAADFVLIESTYGDREHPESDGSGHQDMADAICRTIDRGGSIVMPAFAIDRTEAILKVLTQMIKTERIPNIPVFVDSPMALTVLSLYADEASDELAEGITADDFIGIPKLRETRTSQESKALNSFTKPCIIISSSGMCEGGRVLHHLKRLLPDAKNTVILTGYQAAGSRGRALEDGAREVKIQGRYVRVRAEIVRDHDFSVHADASDLMDWLKDLDREPENVFIVHGEPEVATIFADRIGKELEWSAVVPTYGEVVELTPDGREPFIVIQEGTTTTHTDNSAADGE